MNDLEHRIQVAVANFLDVALPESVVWFAVPNGGDRHPKVGAKLKAEGVKAGVADLLLFWEGQSLAIEMKTPTGRQTATQKDFARRWQATGRSYVVCRSVDDVQRVLGSHGFPLKARVI